jgi:hypothetical protein
MVQTHQDSREEGMTMPIPLRRLKIFGMGRQILKNLYSCTVENLLTGCITAWYGNCSSSNHKTLQRVVGTAKYITGPSFLPSRTSILGGVRGRPKITPATLVKDCSLCYRIASATGAPSLGPKGSLTASTPKIAEQLIKLLPGLFALTNPRYSLFIIFAVTLPLPTCTYSLNYLD